MKYKKPKLLCWIGLLMINACVSSHIFEDALVVGKGGHTVEGVMVKGFHKPKLSSQDGFIRFISKRELGIARFTYLYGIGHKTDVGIGLDLPLGFHAKVKQKLPWGNLKHIHSIKTEVYLPITYLWADDFEIPKFTLNPVYLYTYRYDDLLSASVNASFLAIKTNIKYVTLPGISIGVHIGDEMRFTLGVSYFNNFGKYGQQKLQYGSVEVGIKYDL
jgi:hypothetical protein